MDASQQARLFQAFEQVAETSRQLGGTGLGLSISQQLVRLMGGVISVQSAAGQGSCFSFEITANTA
jgi:signal transduction histidine kinase